MNRISLAISIALPIPLGIALALATSEPEVGSNVAIHQPAAGYIAVPRTIDVQEDEALMAQIIEYLGG